MDHASDGAPAGASLCHSRSHRARVADVNGHVASRAASTADGLQSSANLTHSQDGGHAAAQLGRAGALAPGLGVGEQDALEFGIRLDPVTARRLVFHGRAPEQQESAAGRARQFDHTGRGHPARSAGNHHHGLRVERQGRSRGQRRRHGLQDHARPFARKTDFSLHSTGQQLRTQGVGHLVGRTAHATDVDGAHMRRRPLDGRGSCQGRWTGQPGALAPG